MIAPVSIRGRYYNETNCNSSAITDDNLSKSRIISAFHEIHSEQRSTNIYYYNLYEIVFYIASKSPEWSHRVWQVDGGHLNTKLINAIAKDLSKRLFAT